MSRKINSSCSVKDDDFITYIKQLCHTPDFWSYLTWKSGIACTSQDKAGIIVCGLLRIRELSELLTNLRARGAWDNVTGEFSLWFKKIYGYL